MEAQELQTARSQTLKPEGGVQRRGLSGLAAPEDNSQAFFGRPCNMPQNLERYVRPLRTPAAPKQPKHPKLGMFHLKQTVLNRDCSRGCKKPY